MLRERKTDHNIYILDAWYTVWIMLSH